MRIHLAQWRSDKINKGRLSDWRRAVTHVLVGKHVKDVNLLVDSTDFRLSGKSIIKPIKCSVSTIKTRSNAINCLQKQSIVQSSLDKQSHL
jgi:hypothetical protein